MKTFPGWLVALGVILMLGVVVRLSVASRGGATVSRAQGPWDETAEQVRQDTIRGWTASGDRSLKNAAKACQQHADWDTHACELVGKQEIAIGMTSDQVLASWGKPHHVNTTYLERGDVEEQWVYDDLVTTVAEYVYLSNGMVTSMQNER